METLTETETVKTEQKINLIDGCFTASEAKDIINDVLQIKINFHKLQRLSKTEGNMNDSCQYDNSRINELISEQNISKEFFNDIRIHGKKLNIKSTIHITVED